MMPQLEFLFTSFILILFTFTGIDAATFYCPDPLNIQTNRGDATPTPASTSSAGIVTCGTGLTTPGCGIVITTGAGICTTLTTPSSTIVVTALNAATATTAPADISAFTSAQGAIKSCYNPAGTAVATVSPALSATNAIIACFTTKAGIGSPVFQTVGATTTASTAVSLASGGSYCFTTNCNAGIWINSKSTTLNTNYSATVLFFLMGALTTLVIAV